MGFYIMAILAAGLIMAFMSVAQPVPCPPNAAIIDVYSTADIHILTDVLACTGEGSFNITWHHSLTVEQKIKVSDNKNVTITGTDSRSSVRGAFADGNTDTIVNAGDGKGMFSVSNGSTLRLNYLVLEGGRADTGGAVDVLSNSSLFLFGCTFRKNNASKGGAIYASTSAVYIGGNNSFGDNSAIAGGAICANESEIHIDGITHFSHNSAEGALARAQIMESSSSSQYFSFSTSTPDNSSGGALYAEASVVSIDGDTYFVHNSAEFQGGAILAISSEVGIDGNISLANNFANCGGALFGTFSRIAIDGTAGISYNSAVSERGGAFYADDSSIDIDGNTMFSFNSANENGGAIYASSSNISLHGNAQFVSNPAILSGGAIYVGESDLFIHGSTIFTNNTADLNGGAIYGTDSNYSFTDGKIFPGDLSDNEGGIYSGADGNHTSNWSVVFYDNYAAGLGGAVFIQRADIVQVNHVMFESNEAALGGALFIAAVEDKTTVFSECAFEGNSAADGGAVYLNTGPGLDIFTRSIFRGNYARTSGGAIFHTGSMHVFNTSFVANEVGVEGPAIMSIGFLEKLSYVSFSENTYRCRAGQYGYVDRKETEFCIACFDEVCSRCSTSGEGIASRKEVRIDGLPTCAQPPPGATTLSSGTTLADITLARGYFRASNQSHIVLKCYQENACRGGNEADKYCASGYTGPYCAVCAEGFAPGIAYSCRQCSEGITRSAVALVVAVGLAGLLLIVLLLSYLGSAANDAAEGNREIAQPVWRQQCSSCRRTLGRMLPLTAIKIVVTVWQIISQFDAIAGDIYPELYRSFVYKLTPINLDLDFAFSYSCLVTNDFYDHLAFATLTPIIVLAVLAGSYFAAKKKHSFSESAKIEVRHKHQAAVLYVAFFVYSPVSYKIFQTFGCDPLDDGETYLRADYSLSCSTSRHSSYETYALVMVCVYPFGIAAAFAGLLLWHRRDLVKPERENVVRLKPLKGVWAAYKPSRYYYEVVEFGRRIALTGIAAFVLPNSTAQISFALLFAVVFVFLSESLSPFVKGVDMGLYRWGNGIVVASMYVAFLMKVDVGEDTMNALLTFSGVLIAANVFMVVTVLIQTVLLVKEMRPLKGSIREVGPIRRSSSALVREVSWLYEE